MEPGCQTQRFSSGTGWVDSSIPSYQLFHFEPMAKSIRKWPSHYVLQFGGLSIRDVSTSSTRTAVSHNQFLQIHPASYKFSADRSALASFLPLFHLHLCYTRKYLLVKTSNQRVWRRSSFGDYGLLRMAQNGRPASSTVTNLLISNCNT